jgi:hypothetical protein
MDRIEIRCFCRVSVSIDRSNASVGKVCEASGYHAVSNIRNGLEIQYVCPKCWERVVSAIQTLAEVFGKDARYIHFGSLFPRSKP